MICTLQKNEDFSMTFNTDMMINGSDINRARKIVLQYNIFLIHSYIILNIVSFLYSNAICIFHSKPVLKIVTTFSQTLTQKNRSLQCELPYFQLKWNPILKGEKKENAFLWLSSKYWKTCDLNTLIENRPFNELKNIKNKYSKLWCLRVLSDWKWLKIYVFNYWLKELNLFSANKKTLAFKGKTLLNSKSLYSINKTV